LSENHNEALFYYDFYVKIIMKLFIWRFNWMYGQLLEASELFKSADQSYQNVHYHYFLPTLLNQGYEVKLSSLYLLSEKAVKLITQLNSNSRNIKQLEIFIQRIVQHEAVESSSLEGTKTTFAELVLPEERTEDLNKQHDRQEVENYVQAIWQAQNLLEELPTSERYCKDLHRTLLSGVRGSDKKPGDFRTVQNWIGGRTIKTAQFVPPHPSHLSMLIQDLFQFWHNDSLMITTPMKIALFHYQFETIHPFMDGNGRLGRLLMLAQLMESELLDNPCLNVSVIFNRNKERYTERLKYANTTGDLDSWILFFLDSFIEAAEHTSETYKAFSDLQNECDDKIVSLKAKMYNAKKLLDHLYETPYSTIRMTCEYLGITPQTAKNLHADLIDLGIVTNYRPRLPNERIQEAIRFSKYIDIFHS
jgi:Fic family protein